MMAFILIPAMAINLVLAVMLRAERPAFHFALTGCIVLAATLAVFFAITQPANAATQNWTVVPAGWEELRTRWGVFPRRQRGADARHVLSIALATLTARR
jgi:hypothetical protein